MLERARVYIFGQFTFNNTPLVILRSRCHVRSRYTATVLPMTYYILVYNIFIETKNLTFSYRQHRVFIARSKLWSTSQRHTVSEIQNK